MYVRRFHYYPLLESSAELRQALISRTKDFQASGRRVALQEQVVPGGGMCYVMAEIFDNLAALDAQRQEHHAAFTGVTSPAARELVALLRAPISTTLYETVIGFPPA